MTAKNDSATSISSMPDEFDLSDSEWLALIREVRTLRGKDIAVEVLRASPFWRLCASTQDTKQRDDTDDLMEFISTSGGSGRTRTEITRAFKSVPTGTISDAIVSLEAAGLIASEVVSGAGRPTTIYRSSGR